MTRTDVDVEYTTSPRVLEVRDTSTEMIMQDLVDTARKLEDSFQGMGFPKLINASGKEDLGGGTKVGITVSMQNMLLSFAARTTPAETGSVTTNPGSSVIGRDSFTDSNALFITSSVVRGSLVINFTDQSIADVVSVDSETKLTTKTLVNGIGNTFDVADVYHVFNIIQVSAAGGNLTAVDGVQASIAAVLPTAFTQVLLTSSSSATLQEQKDIQFASFSGGVTIDASNSTGNAAAGTVFPAGTPRQPSLLIADGLSISQLNGLPAFYIIGDVTLDGTLDFTNCRFIGQGQNLSVITLDPSAIIVNATLMNAEITGTLDGEAHIVECIIAGLTFVSGVIEKCILNPGTITLGGAMTADFVDCVSGVPGTGTPIIDMGGSGQALALRNYNGGIEIRNKTGTESVSIDMNSGQVIVNNTVTNGTILLRGVGKWTNKATYSGGATVIDELVNTVAIGAAVWDALIVSHSVTGSFGEFIVRRLLTVAKFFSLRT